MTSEQSTASKPRELLGLELLAVLGVTYGADAVRSLLANIHDQLIINRGLGLKHVATGPIVAGMGGCRAFVDGSGFGAVEARGTRLEPLFATSDDWRAGLETSLRRVEAAAPGPPQSVVGTPFLSWIVDGVGSPARRGLG